MYACQMDLENFRSYAAKSVEFSPGVNIIWGNNAQGKTNLLEALFFCAVTRSFRGATDKELAHRGSTDYRVELEFFARGRPQHLKVLCQKGHKEFYLNGVKQMRRSQVVGALKCVLFAPEHLSLVKSGPGERRRFMDMSLCQLRPAYYGALQSYQKLLEQKNVLLKRMEGRRDMAPMLELYNEKLAGYAAEIISMRGEYLDQLQQYGSQVQLELSSGAEELTLEYQPSPRVDVHMPREEMQQLIVREMSRHMERELVMRSALVGCHRDNFEIRINGYSARNYGSQGQQRSCVLALKMAECNIFKELYGEYPILLLDDIMSELDSRRKQYIVGHISDRQVIITCCDKEVFEELHQAKIIPVGEPPQSQETERTEESHVYSSGQ